VLWEGRNIQTRDFGYLPAGMYVLQIDQGKEISTLKIFKERECSRQSTTYNKATKHKD
jgi:hypothetical protein